MNKFVFLDDVLPVETDKVLPLPIIYYAPYLQGEIPKGFSAVVIKLNGRADASLDWRVEKQAARQYVEQGYNLFWELDLGLFEHLASGLSDQQQFLSLSLSLQHFKETLWKDFYEHTVGLSLYRGKLDASASFTWDDKQVVNLQGWLEDCFGDIQKLNQFLDLNMQNFGKIEPKHLDVSLAGKRVLALFCNDAMVDYAEQLAKQLPGELAVCAMYQVDAAMDVVLQTLLISKERFDRIHRVMNTESIPVTAFAIKPMGLLSDFFVEIPVNAHATLGICVPSREVAFSTYVNSLKIILKQVLESKIAFRIIPEMTMTTEWDGIDYMLVVPAAVSSQGLRKLRGFCAAGGTVVVLDESQRTNILDCLPQVITFNLI